MQKVNRTCMIFIVILLCALFVGKCFTEEEESEGLSMEEALKLLNDYDASQVHAILIGINGGTASGRYYLLTQEEDAEYIQQFKEMFWGESAVYVEKDPYYKGYHGWQITFIDTAGELLTLKVYVEQEVSYEGKHFVQNKIDSSILHQFVQNNKKQ